jgi:DtxR family Mn-dependent transcriptional regulator
MSLSDAASDASQRSETGDRYLETIYYMIQEGLVARPGRLAEWLGVSAPTVSVSLQRLARNGWIDIRGDRSVSLTEAGAAAAATIVRRHRLLERWLTDELGLDWATADREAAALAHGLSDLVLERLDERMGHPVTCPHGNVVPGRRPPSGRPLMRLTDLAPDVEAPVARVSEVAEHEAPHLLAELHGLGLVPGTVVSVVAGSGGRELIVAGRPLRLSEAAAQALWVQRPTV